MTVALPRLTAVAGTGTDATETLTLSFDERQRSCFLARLDSGGEVGVVLPRGLTLRHGDCLIGPCGLAVRVRAAEEAVSVVRMHDAICFSRACRRMGNPRIPVQIAAGELRYRHDHVLDSLLRAMGVDVSVRTERFDPEPPKGLPAGAPPPLIPSARWLPKQ